MTERRRNLRDVIADPLTPERLRQLQAEGATLREIASDWRVPYARLVSWIAGQGDLSEELKRIREIAGHELVGETLAIADASDEDVDEEGKVRADVIQRSKLRVDTRLKIAKAFAPKTYGEHQQVDWSVKFETEEEIRAKIRAVLARNPELKQQVVGLLEAKGISEAEIIEIEGKEKNENGGGASDKNAQLTVKQPEPVPVSAEYPEL